MAIYYPEGNFGPVCDIPPTDAEIAQRARFALSDTDRLGEDADRVVTLDLTGIYDSMQDVIGEVPSFLERQRCKQRTLPDGTIENYDCEYDFAGDLGENYDDGWDAPAAGLQIGANDNFIQPTLLPTSCSKYKPDINIRPLTFFNADGTLFTKTATENSSPVTFPVESYLWTQEANEYGVWVNAAECTLPLAVQTVTYKVYIDEAGTYGFTFGADNDGSLFVAGQTSAFLTTSNSMVTGGSSPATTTRYLTVGINLFTVTCTNQTTNPPTILESDYLWNSNPAGWYLKIFKGAGGAEVPATNISWVPAGPHPLWSTFMDTYAVWPSNNNPLLDTTFTETYNINIPSTGTYDFECQADTTANFTLSPAGGSSILSLTNVNSYTTSTTSSFTTSSGLHTLVVAMSNTSASGNVPNTWVDNPGGSAWTIKKDGAIIATSLDVSTSSGRNLYWHTRTGTGYTYSVT